MEALEYARRGWYVFPCRERPGEPYLQEGGEMITPTTKQPYVSKGLYDSSIDEKQIRAWWGKWQTALIGVNAGKSGLFVVDIDKKHVNGFDTFSKWNINDQSGFHTITPSGGMHIIFTGSGKTSTNGKTGIDTRGEGGYFIAPPSEIIGGESVGVYKRMDDWAGAPGVIPDGLMSNLFPETTTEYVRGNNSTHIDGGKKMLSRDSLTFLATGAKAGERNHTLFKVLADFAGCGYPQDETRNIVKDSSIRSGLSMSEFEQVLAHAYSKPRTASIPDSIQEKIMAGSKNVVAEITYAEQEIIEDALIGCMLADNSNIPIVNDILSFDDFQVLKNRLIYRAINILRSNSSNVIDYVVVYDAVCNETDKVSLEDLAELVNMYPISAESAMAYANIIKEKSSLRKVEALMDNKGKYLCEGGLLNVVTSIERDLTNIAVSGGARSTAVLTSEQATEMVRVQTEKMRSGEIGQLKIGFPAYDNIIGGLYSNELVVLAGRSGCGKSALALSILHNVSIIQKKPAALFSLEMSTHESVCRLVCQLTGLPFKDVYQGRLDTDEWKRYTGAINRISESKLYFDDGFGMTVPEIRSKIRKLVDSGIQLIVIDQLEQVRGYEGLQTHLQYDKIAYDIKSMTQEFNIPIILNHQLNRSITDRKLVDPEPQLSDLNQAGEKPANQVWVITHKKDDKGALTDSKVKVLKNRNGPTMDFDVLFLGERMLFTTPIQENRHESDTKVTMHTARNFTQAPLRDKKSEPEETPWY